MAWTGTRGGLVVALLAVSAAAGCGSPGSTDDPVVPDTRVPAADRYDGPLRVAVRGTGTAAVAGAAGRALECDGTIYSGGGSDPWSKGDGGGTPEAGLRLWFDMVQPDVPRTGYRVERREHDRVLFSYDVDDRTKVAVIVAKDREGRPGWGPETSASCDPAELPASFTKSLPYEIWTGRDGRRVPVTKVSSSVGPAHCDWQSAHFLDLGGKSYARDPEGVLPAGALTSPYRSGVRLPAAARDTGYRYRDWQLWLTPDRSVAYVRTARGVEAWPRVAPGTGCA